MSKHTPTPWQVVHELRDGDEAIADLVNNTWIIPSNRQTLGSWIADAQLIVTACNAYDDMVQTLQSTMFMLEELRGTEANEEGAITEQIREIKASLEKAGVA